MQVNPHIVPFFFDASRSVATRSHGTGFLTSFAERALKADMVRRRSSLLPGN